MSEEIAATYGDDDYNNAILEAINTLSQDDMRDILAAIDPVAWTEHRRILKGRPFSFENRNYLLEPYRDEYQHLLFMKGRQVEMSEFSMNWLLRKLDAHPYTAGLHAFPRSAQTRKFSKLRLAAAIKDSAYLSEWYSERESEQELRKFIRPKDENGLTPYNFYILGATWQSHKDTVGDASRGISLDFIVYDERQDHPNDVETVLGEGASHSEFKQSITLGTPKLPGIQFDQQWEASDKRFWHVTCNTCGRVSPLTMENILEGKDEYYYGCPKCRGVLDRGNGEWLVTNPSKYPEYHGYHINQLMTAWITATEIKRKQNSTNYSKRRFANEVLGESYGGDDLPITVGMMMECADNNYKLGETNGDPLYVGVDWGAESYCYIQNKSGRLIDCKIAADGDPREQPKSIARFIKKYNKAVKKVVCDAGPDITRTYSLRDELKEIGVRCEVWACYYTSPPAKTDVTWNDKDKVVTVGRSEIIDQVIDEIHDGKCVMPGADIELDVVDTLIEHFTNIAAERATNSAGNEYIMYVNTGPDHFLHAKLYATVASGGAVTVAISGSVGAAINPRKQDKRVSGLINMGRTRKY